MLAGLFIKYVKPYLFPALMLAFIVGNMYVLIYKRFYFYPYNLLPVILFVVYVAVFHLQKLLFFLAFCTPFSVTLKELGLTQGPNLSIPTEPIMALIMLLYILNELQHGISDKKFTRHSISTIVAIQLAWMFLTTCTSVDFVVSAKYFVSRLWFIFSCYLIAQHLFQNRKNIITFVFSYASALAIVACYSMAIHAQYNFNDKAADWVVSPFYNDHTAYGAALAMFIPVMLSFLFMKTVSKNLKMFALGLFLWFLLAIVLSFARAGWLSLCIALSVFVTLMLRIKLRTIVLVVGSLAILFFTFQTEIILVIGRNVTNAEGGFENNIESVYNISTDASNLERLNRWSCAIRMWQDKPILGWGPGTYMFQYAPYQLSRELTIISTNFATGGNAHSEYLGPLSEQGVAGLLIVLALLFYTTSLGYRLVYSLADSDDRILCTGLFLGLVTYFVHGFFNNFLDTDKLSLPFWAFLAALVCFDIYYRKKIKPPKENIPLSPAP